MKSRKTLAVMGVLLASFMGASLVACAGTPEKPDEPGQQVKEYTVTFDANGGTLTGNSTVKVKEGEKIANAPTATKAEHTFEAWYDAATGGVKIALTTYTVSADVTLYAHYTQDTPTPPTGVKITFDANGGTFEGNKQTVDKTPDEDHFILDLEDPTRENYRFNGWYTAKTGGESVDPMFDEMTETQTLYAQWVRQYTVTFNAGDGTLDGAATLKFDEGAKITGAPIASKPGNDFYGWFTAAEDGEKVDLETYTVGGDATLYAKFGEYTMPLKVLKDKGAVIGYTIEAETSKYNITAESWWQWVGITSPVETVESASGGKSLGYLGTANDTITFTFKAATAGKAKLSLRVTSSIVNGQNGPIVDAAVSNDTLGVKVNNKDVTYSGTAPGSNEPNVYNKYWASIELGEFDLIAGTNIVVLTVKKQSCNLDCLDIQTTVALTAVNGDAASGESTLPEPPAPDVVYDKAVTGKLIVVDHADGPAVEKAVLTFVDDIPVAAIATNPFSVGGMGVAATDKVYLSDADGNKLDTATTSKYVTIEYAYTYSGWGPAGNVKPFTYNQQTGRNTWNAASTYKLDIKDLTIGETTYTKFGGTFTAKYDIPVLKDWDTTGSYTDPVKVTVGEGESAEQREITLKYASFTPAAVESKTDKKPLIVWLHGAGEGGTDPSIVLLGNQVVNLGKPLIQDYFTTNTCAGAYVLAPQSPTMWMDSGNGQQGGNNIGESIYTESLFKLIEKFVTDNADIDANRVYIGGCSNGGWMTIEMLSKHGEFFAAAFPIAVPFVKDAGMTADEFAKLVNVPMWITHAKVDPTVKIGNFSTPANWWEQGEFQSYAELNSNQLYIELLKAGATNVHYSLFDTVTIAAGETDAATYNGHYSWIYVLRDECSKVQATTGTGTDGAFVLADITEAATGTVTLTEGGEAVTLWGWIAAQAKTPAQPEA